MIAVVERIMGFEKRKADLGNIEFTHISDYKTKSYVNSMSYGEVYDKKYLLAQNAAGF